MPSCGLSKIVFVLSGFSPVTNGGTNRSSPVWTPGIVWPTVFWWYLLQLHGISYSVFNPLFSQRFQGPSWRLLCIALISFRLTNSSHPGLPELWSLCRQLNEISGFCLGLPLSAAFLKSASSEQAKAIIQSARFCFFQRLLSWAACYIWK